MPLRVLCPSGCQLRIPSNRAGRMGRCPECKSTISIPQVSESQLKSGKPILVKATRVEPTRGASDDGTESLPPEPVVARPRLGVPLDLTPKSVHEKKLQHKAKLKEILSTPETIPSFKRISVTPTESLGRKTQPRFRRVKPPPVVNVVESDRLAEVGEQPPGWEDRVRKSNADRVVLTRFFALSLIVTAVINLVPAFYFWSDWFEQIEPTQLPRWIYLQFFVAGIHVMYAVFLFQIPDWSALRAVSFAMLAIAFVFGLVSTGLLIGGAQGGIAVFLGLSFTMVQRAAIWCVAMLCVATLMCYLGGKEASNWQRAEELLEEILTGQTVA